MAKKNRTSRARRHEKKPRSAPGLTQRDLAALSNVSLRKIQRYERGTLAPSIDEFTKLSAALGLDPLKFFAKVMREAGI